MRYSDAARKLSGNEIAIEGFLSHGHGPRTTVLLVDQPGLCPDCSAVPAAAISLLGSPSALQEGEVRPVRVVGRLDYGFRIDDGLASFIRIEGATVEPLEMEA
jgi:hypothetical protein